MPAPKKFNPAPTASPSYTTRHSSDTAKGRYAIVPPVPKPRIHDEEPVEIAVDEVTVVMGSVSKYEARSLHAHVEPGLSIEIDEFDEFDEADEVAEPVEPVRPAPVIFGEWRTESNLEGTHYHRKDSRRT
jgi:hypothetical protein